VRDAATSAIQTMKEEVKRVVGPGRLDAFKHLLKKARRSENLEPKWFPSNLSAEATPSVLAAGFSQQGAAELAYQPVWIQFR